MLGKIAHFAGEGNFSLGVQSGGDAYPASDDGFPGLSQPEVRRVADRTCLGKFCSDTLDLLAQRIGTLAPLGS